MEEIMADNRRNSLRPMSLPTRNDLRSALAQIVRSVQAEHGLTDEALADLLGVSDGTIRNVRNERTDLNQETIAKLGARFGPECLDPWSACFGGRNVPKEASDHRISLTAVTGSLRNLSLATDVGSKGGVPIPPCEPIGRPAGRERGVQYLEHLVVPVT